MKRVNQSESNTGLLQSPPSGMTSACHHTSHEVMTRLSQHVVVKQKPAAQDTCSVFCDAQCPQYVTISQLVDSGIKDNNKWH